MKILHISTSDRQGGAARATFRLHLSLLENGVDSQMLVQQKKIDILSIIGPNSRIKKITNRFKPIFDQFLVNRYKNKIKTLFSPSWLPTPSIIKKINRINPDIVHLHWINFGMIRIEELRKINAPIVWSLHDNWAFTGGCHIMWTCEKYKTSCGNCPTLNSKKENDLSSWVFKRKLKTYSKMDNLTLIGLSKWMRNCAKKSYLFKEMNVINLPNPIDTKQFKPLDKLQSRDLWNLPQNKTLILFGALSPNSDINKGFKELKNALQMIEDPNIELVIFGADPPLNDYDANKYKKNYVGELVDSESLVTLYSACNLTIVPSLQENLSNVIMESLSCGTPVVAFDVGGNSDLIDHLQNGYLATPYDLKDLVNGIHWAIDNLSHVKIFNNVRKKILTEFSSTVVAAKYINMYQSILLNTQRTRRTKKIQ